MHVFGVLFLAVFVVIEIKLSLPDCTWVFASVFSEQVFFVVTSAVLRALYHEISRFLPLSVNVGCCFCGSFHLPECFHYFSESSVLLFG